MTFFDQIISEPFINALGWTILHSLWQGALIALILGVFLLFLQKKSAKSRYILSSVGLVVLFLTASTTFVVLYQNELQAAEHSIEIISATQFLNNLTYESSTISASDANQGFFTTAVDYFNQHLPTIVVLWLLGIMIMSLRFLGGMAYLQRLKHTQHTPLSPRWQQYLKDIKNQLRLERPVQLVESALVNVPMVIGYVKPMILIPIGTIAGLHHKQVEAILAHELAHIYRHDFIVNIIQSVIEMVLFYHPAVWWISSIIREERENCCDDLAIQLCGDSLNYAKALTNLEAMKLNVPKYSLAFTGRKNQLFNRITRLMGHHQPKKNFSEGFVAACVLVFCLFVSTSFNASANFVESDEISTDLHTPAWYMTDTVPPVLPAPPVKPTEPVAPMSPTPAVAPTTPLEVAPTAPVLPKTTTPVIAPTAPKVPKGLKAPKAPKPPKAPKFKVKTGKVGINYWQGNAVTPELALVMPTPSVGNIDANITIAPSNLHIDRVISSNISKRDLFGMANYSYAMPNDTDVIDWDKKFEESEVIIIDGDKVIILTDKDDKTAYKDLLEGNKLKKRDFPKLKEFNGLTFWDYEGGSGSNSLYWDENGNLTEGLKLHKNYQNKIIIKGNKNARKALAKSRKYAAKSKKSYSIIQGNSSNGDNIYLWSDDHDKFEFEFDDDFISKANNMEAIYEEMVKDGLLENKSKINIEIKDETEIKINGKKIPNNLKKKYHKLLGVK